jgi:hypothetical protein
VRNFSRAHEFAELEPSPPLPPQQMRGFPRPRPNGNPGGVLVLANDTPGALPFVGNQTNGARVGLFSAEREAEMWGAPPCAISLPQPTGSTTGFVGM